jgi:hypothetical protein
LVYDLHVPALKTNLRLVKDFIDRVLKLLSFGCPHKIVDKPTNLRRLAMTVYVPLFIYQHVGMVIDGMISKTNDR